MLAPKVMNYLTSVFHGAHPQKEVGIRTTRELATLATALDDIAAGRLPQVADLLMQRFKAVEASVIDGDWTSARHLELLPRSGVGLTSMKEKHAAVRAELDEVKLRERKKGPK